MGQISDTDEFHRENNNDRKQSLYTAFRFADDTMKTIDNKKIQKIVMDRIDLREKNNPKAKEFNNDEKELDALATISRLVIYIKSINKNIQENKTIIKSQIYKQDVYKKCIYMLYDEDREQYFALYISNKENVNEIQTIFPTNTLAISNLLEKYLQKEYPNYFEWIPPPEQNCEIDQPVSGIEETDNALGEPSNGNSELSESFATESRVSVDDDTLKMKFDVEPIKRFRSRTKGDFLNNKNAKSEAPRYFANRNKEHCFKLLIPSRYLGDNLEYRIEMHLITRNLRGNSYINAYFNIQNDPTDDQTSGANPMERKFKNEDLKIYNTGIKFLSMKFVIVKTKIAAAMKIQQPLRLFSLKNKKTRITETFTKHTEFKRKYCLDQLRFAIRLYSRNFGETTYRPCDDAVYVSQISTAYSKLNKTNNKN